MTEGGRLAGPGELRYRAGTYATFLDAMQRGARHKPPLATLNTETESDFTNALLSAWARVCDVLTFYQERIANEGYLPTAVEPVSVLYLAAEIGERRKPAVGAQTHLALQLVDAAGQPASLTIEPGPSVVVQNAPASPNTLPVVFECGEHAELRPAWNALPLAIAAVPLLPALWSGCRSLRLVGTATGIRAGSALLLDSAGGRSWLVIVDTVQVDRSLGCTLITWSSGIPAAAGFWRATVTGVTQFERSAGLFGRTAMQWADVDEKQKEEIGVRAGGAMTLDQCRLAPVSRAPAWELWTRPAYAQPPPANIRALLGIGGGTLLAGTDRGLFRSADGGVTWEGLALPQPHGWHDILCLHRDQAGTLYVGTGAGLVLTSRDGGDQWTMLTQTVIPIAGEKQPGFLNILEDLRIRDRSKPHEKWTLRSPIRAILTPTIRTGGMADIYIGTDQGVFAMLGEAPGWQPYNDGLKPGDDGATDVAVADLAIASPWILAATGQGLFMSSTGSWTAIVDSPVECTCLATNSVGQVFVGTEKAGVFELQNMATFRPRNEGFEPSPPPITALAATVDILCAATGAGLYGGYPAGWSGWHSLDQELTLFEIDAVFADGLDDRNVSIALRQRFERFGIELNPDVTVQDLYLPRYQPHMPPGLRLAWELREPDAPNRTFRIHPGEQLRVTQLVRNQAGPDDRVVITDIGPVASLPLGPVVNTEWPDFAIATGTAWVDGPVQGAELFLDRKVDGIETGSQIVLAPASTSLEPLPQVHTVLATDAVLHKAFGKQGTVTQIIVEPTAELLAADLRTTNVYLANRAVAPFTAANPNPRPVAGDVLRLPGILADLAPGRYLQISGPRPGAVVVPTDDRLGDAGQERLVARTGAEAGPALDQQMVSPGLRDAFVAAGIKLSASPGVIPLTLGARWLVRDGDQAWRLDLAPDANVSLPLSIFAATLFEVVSRPTPQQRSWTLLCGDEIVTVPELGNEVVWQGATSSQAVIAEIATIQAVATHIEANVTEVTLRAPLANLYDSALCRICANVVLATQGETVQSEVLGSGRPGQSGQSFTLHNAPLTYTRSRDGYGIHSELQVEVNGAAGRALRFGAGSAAAEPPGERWREISSLALAGPSQRVYAVTIDEGGGANLSFGDGVHGARLPSGNENVAAKYRYGAGAQGNVPPGSLIALRKRPPGIRSATNPVAATGGTDAEAIDALRVRAPRKLGYCDRIVTLSDYEAYARNFTGIGWAQVALIDTGDEAPTIWLTAVTDSWLPISQAPALRKALFAAIEARRADRLPLRLEDPLVVPFDVGLSIAIDEGVEPASAVRQARSTLAAAFGPALRDFAQGVDPQDVIEALRAVPGLRSAELAALYRSATPSTAILPLTAAPARFDLEVGLILPAEWLLIDAAAGISITVRG